MITRGEIAMSDVDDFESRPRKRKKEPKVDSTGRAMSYGFGVLMFLLGTGLIVWYYHTQRAPAKAFNLLAAGGVAALLSGLGLFLHPLDEERLHTFQKEPNPITVFRIMPPFWKVWMLVILAAMIGAFVYVAKTTVRVG
jgi:hypothetical protein